MDKKTIEKVLDILSKHGVDENVISEVESLKEETPADDPATPTDDNVDTPPDVPPAQEEGDVPPAEGQPDPNEGDGAKGDPVPPVDDGAVPPVDDATPPIVPDAPADANPAGVNDIDLSGDVVPPADVVPPTDPTPAPAPVDYEGKIEEQNKTIDALKAQVDALEDALRKGGILTDESKKENGEPVGVDDPTNIGASLNDEELMDSVLADINKKY